VKAERKVDDATAQLVAVLSGGSLSRALELDVEGLERRTEIIQAFDALRGEEDRSLLAFAEAFARSRDDAEDALRILAVWLRDVAAAKAGRPTVNRDLEALAKKAAERVSGPTLHHWHDVLEEAMEAIATRNGSPRMQVERMLIEMRA
jgi:DNA polymerase-3 subunit delta'